MSAESKAKKKLMQTVNEERKQLIGFLRDLIRIPSPTGEEKTVQMFLRKSLVNMGLKTEMWEPDLGEIFQKYPSRVQYPSHWKYGAAGGKGLQFTDRPSLRALRSSPLAKKLNYKNRPVMVGAHKGSGDGKSIILNGHVDVFPVERPSDWKYDPWGAQIASGRMYGRGAIDMKGGVAAMIMALKCILDSEIELKGDVIVETVSDEEASNNGTLACLAKGISADAAIVPEPSGCAIAAGNMGDLLWKMRVCGSGGFLDPKAKSRGAIDKLPMLINALKEFEKEQSSKLKVHPAFRGVPSQFMVILGKITGGYFGAASASEVELDGTILFNPYLDIDEVKRLLREKFNVTIQDAQFKDFPPELKFWHYDDSSAIDVNHPFVQTMKMSFREALNREPSPVSFSGGCDLPHLIKLGGIPGVVFGPGTTKEAYAIDESISLEEWTECTKVIGMSILNWCGVQ